MSNDRACRFFNHKPSRVFHSNSIRVEKRDRVVPGDWCVFLPNKKDKNVLPGIKFVLGRILSLGLIKGSKAERSKPIWEKPKMSEHFALGIL
jgi:hypothetical protein